MRRVITVVTIVIGGCAALAQQEAAAPKADLYTYRGYSFDVSALRGTTQEKNVLAGVREQVDIVEKVALSPETRAILRGFVVQVGEGRGGGRYGMGGNISINLTPRPDDRPILLHEFMHAYMFNILPGRARNPELAALFDKVKMSERWPADSYMLTNRSEFFAMTGSVALYGHAAGPPYTRKELTAKQPELVAWLDRTVH